MALTKSILWPHGLFCLLQVVEAGTDQCTGHHRATRSARCHNCPGSCRHQDLTHQATVILPLEHHHHHMAIIHTKLLITDPLLDSMGHHVHQNTTVPQTLVHQGPTHPVTSLVLHQIHGVGQCQLNLMYNHHQHLCPAWWLPLAPRLQPNSRLRWQPPLLLWWIHATYRVPASTQDSQHKNRAHMYLLQHSLEVFPDSSLAHSKAGWLVSSPSVVARRIRPRLSEGHCPGCLYLLSVCIDLHRMVWCTACGEFKSDNFQIPDTKVWQFTKTASATNYFVYHNKTRTMWKWELYSSYLRLHVKCVTKALPAFDNHSKMPTA